MWEESQINNVIPDGVKCCRESRTGLGLREELERGPPPPVRSGQASLVAAGGPLRGEGGFGRRDRRAPGSWRARVVVGEGLSQGTPPIPGVLSVPGEARSPRLCTDPVSLARRRVRPQTGRAVHCASAARPWGTSVPPASVGLPPPPRRPHWCRWPPLFSCFRPITLFSSNLVTKPIAETVSSFSPTRCEPAGPPLSRVPERAPATVTIRKAPAAPALRPALWAAAGTLFSLPVLDLRAEGPHCAWPQGPSQPSSLCAHTGPIRAPARPPRRVPDPTPPSAYDPPPTLPSSPHPRP